MSVRVGVIGAGLMGSTHVRTLTVAVPDAEVAAVSDAIRDNAERIAREAGVETVYTDALELIHDPGVDAAVIASPADTHEQFVLACIEAGKPVLCEKPLAATPEAAGHVLDAEVALDRRLIQVGFMRRFDPGYLELQAHLRRSEIGTPVLVCSTHRLDALERIDPSMAVNIEHEDQALDQLEGLRFASDTLLQATRPQAVA